MHNLFRGALYAVIASGLIAADAPYAGKWKMNPAKSSFGDSIITYETMPGGEIKATMDGMSYTFKMDGKDYPTPWGFTSSWKTVDANSWDATSKVNGKVVESGTTKLSADGKTLTVETKAQQADGSTSNNTTVFQRVSGGPGLAGKWKTKNVRTSVPGVIELTAKPDGLTFTYVNDGASCDAKFDGKDYPATGAMFPAGWTCMIAKSGENGLDITWKKDGKALYLSNYTVSGKTLTELTSATGSGDRVKIIWEKQ
jgi:hypothetical protein